MLRQNRRRATALALNPASLKRRLQMIVFVCQFIMRVVRAAANTKVAADGIIEMDGDWGISQRGGWRHRQSRRIRGGEDARVGLGIGSMLMMARLMFSMTRN